MMRMNRMKRVTHTARSYRLSTVAAWVLLVLIGVTESFAQLENASSFILNRGKLWQTFGYGKSGPSFSNWTKRGIGLDWPGFDATLINENIGGSPSYLASGGLYVGAKWHRDSVLSVEEWSMYASSISEGGAAKYTVTTNREVYPNGTNYWLQSNGNAGEHMLQTVWEYNRNYSDSFQIKRMLPVRVTRTVHQWSGSKTDENYIIIDYVIKNISAEIKANVAPQRFVADTLHDFIAMLNYGMHANSRSWSVLFPSLSAGARNTWFNYSSSRRLIYGRASDYAETLIPKEDMGFAPSMGPIVNGVPSGEYLAPGFVGVQLLYASKDNTGQTSRVAQYGWAAGSNSIDLSGPFANIGSLEAQYAALKDIRLTANFVASTFDTLSMKKSRMWSLMSVGPYTIAPGDSVRIVIAEIVDGVDYDKAIQPKAFSASVINSQSNTIFLNTANRAQFTFNNNFSHPNPPAAPKFTVDYNRTSSSVANVLTWNRNAELIPDPYNGTNSLTHYIVYRSGYLPIGPWIPLDTIAKGDPSLLSGNLYTFKDSTVDIGKGYYYAITAINSPKAAWTGVQTVTNVPSMETSIFANRTVTPFVATIPPSGSVENVLVVPNPFVIGAGLSQPGVGDKIQFVNIPNPCTIRIYTVRGDLVKTLNVGTGAGAIVAWDQVTNYGQYVESGIYIYHLESPAGNKIGKFAIVR
jgi:hypothetical protein